MSYRQPPQYEPQQGSANNSYAQNGQPGYSPAVYQGRYGYLGPQQFAPLSPWSYFWHSVLFGIPIVGWIFLIIDCFTTTNYNLRSFARSYFCYAVLVLIVVLIVAVAVSAGAIGAGAGTAWNLGTSV